MSLEVEINGGHNFRILVTPICNFTKKRVNFRFRDFLHCKFSVKSNHVTQLSKKGLTLNERDLSSFLYVLSFTTWFYHFYQINKSKHFITALLEKSTLSKWHYQNFLNLYSCNLFLRTAYNFIIFQSVTNTIPNAKPTHINS